MSDETNPDVAELVKRNRETCDHPRDKREARSVAVGSGIPGTMGCHMETAWFCSGCDKPVDSPEDDKLVEQIRKALAKNKAKEPKCTCAGDEDAPIGGHKLRCPRYGRWPL